LICVTLARNGHTVRRTANAKDAYDAVVEALPDVILLDWMLPDGSGPSLARRLRSEPRTKEIPIIMLTARAAEDDKVAGLESGVDDYVTKPFSPRELEARIQAVLRRRTPELSKEAVEIEGLALNPATRTVTGAKKTLKMGPTEFELLHFFMTHPDRVYSRTQILDQVWGDHVFLENRTVDVHIRRLREALSPSGHDRLVETVRGAGYRFLSAS
jgi:two-component system, OmpR family, phosphate regulon response regulator PhoB